MNTAHDIAQQLKKYSFRREGFNIVIIMDAVIIFKDENPFITIALPTISGQTGKRLIYKKCFTPDNAEKLRQEVRSGEYGGKYHYNWNIDDVEDLQKMAVELHSIIEKSFPVKKTEKKERKYYTKYSYRQEKEFFAQNKYDDDIDALVDNKNANDIYLSESVQVPRTSCNVGKSPVKKTNIDMLMVFN
jgi:hypothetical protein